MCKSEPINVDRVKETIPETLVLKELIDVFVIEEDAIVRLEDEIIAAFIVIGAANMTKLV